GQLTQRLTGLRIVPLAERVRQLHANLCVGVAGELDQFITQFWHLAELPLTKPQCMPTHSRMSVREVGLQQLRLQSLQAIERAERVQASQRSRTFGRQFLQVWYGVFIGLP